MIWVMGNELTGPAATWIVTVLLTSITVLLGLIAWFLRREIQNNDKAHDDLRRDVKKLLEGNVAWVTGIGRRLENIENMLLPGRRTDRGA